MAIKYLFCQVGGLYLILLSVLCPQISSQPNSPNSIAAARYLSSTYHEIVGPIAARIKNEPVTCGYADCSLEHSSVLSQLRATNASPQVEFRALKRAVRKTLLHPIVKRAAIASGKKFGRGAKDASLNYFMHRFVHALVAMETVLQTTCESLAPSCASLPTPRSPRKARAAAINEPAGGTHNESDADSDAESQFDVFYESEQVVESQADEAAHAADDVDDPEDSGIRLGLLILQDDNTRPKQQVSRPHTHGTCNSLARQLGHVRCFVLELEAKYDLARLSAGERAAVGRGNGWLCSLITLLTVCAVILVGH